MATPIEHLTLPVNGIRLHVAVAGDGPLVVLLHGFPELWSAWHHQIAGLAAGGFRVAAPDLRGFGASDAPDSPHAYTVVHCVGDVVGIIRALGERSAVVVGHDWGAPIAWNSALLRPDLVRAVVALNGPYRARSPEPPLKVLRDAGLDEYYLFYMQTPSAAAELERDPAATMRTMLFGASGEAALPDEQTLLIPEGGSFLGSFTGTETVPSWVDPDHFARLVSEYDRTGFRKQLYLYHNVDRNWELLAAWCDKPIEQPALLLAGDRDATLVSTWGRRALEAMPDVVPNVRIQWFQGAGHWLQQERPAEVTAALLEFLRAL